MFLLIAGFRISSALALKWESIDYVNGFIIAPNVKKDREFFFPLTDDFKLLLTKMGRKKEVNVFNYSEDGLMFFYRFQQALIAPKDGTKITKRYTMHQLRKTFITKLLEQGIPIHIVKSLADHSNVSTTMKYYAAVNVQKMNEVMNTSRVFGDILGGQ
jgi:integrase